MKGDEGLNRGLSRPRLAAALRRGVSLLLTHVTMVTSQRTRGLGVGSPKVPFIYDFSHLNKI